MSEEVLVKEETKALRICDCGAEPRSGSEYCYNCGGKVIVAFDTNPGVRTFEAAKNGSVRSKQRPKRVRPEPKTVEVMWSRSDGPGFLMLFVALGIAAIVAVLIGIAFYLR